MTHVITISKWQNLLSLFKSIKINYVLQYLFPYAGNLFPINTKQKNSEDKNARLAKDNVILVFGQIIFLNKNIVKVRHTHNNG